MSKATTPQLKVTKNYDLFELHDCNRPLHNSANLLRSMQKHGFMPSSPIHCIKNGNGKLKIIRGNNRLACAKRLGIPVWYVQDETKTDIFDMEGDSKQTWSLADFAAARASAGDVEIQKVLNFQKKHGLPLGLCVDMVGGYTGECGGSGKSRNVKAGTFVSGDMTHANAVARITDLCREKGVEFATCKNFAAAVSRVLRIPGFDESALFQKLSLHAHRMGRRSLVDEYLEELESVYNYGVKGKRVPLKFAAIEAMRARDFGAKGKSPKKR